MSILDFFKPTPPKHKIFASQILNYLKEDQHILECYGDICGSGCVDKLKLNYDLFSKHFKAIHVQILFSCMPTYLKGDNYDKFAWTLIDTVKDFDEEIWTLAKYKYSEPCILAGLEGMIEELNKKPFKGKLDKNITQSLINGMKVIEIELNKFIKSFS